MEPWLTWRLDEIPAGNFQTMLLGAAVAGSFYCFLGYRLFRLTLGLTGFLLAGAVALVLAGWISQGHLLTMAIVTLCGGLCGAAALFFLYRTGVFFLGFLGAMIAAYQLLHARPEPWAPWAILGAALGGGLIALAVERPVMTLTTAFLGAWIAVYAGMMLILDKGWDRQLAEAGFTFPLWWSMAAAWFVLSAVGVGIQHHLAKNGSARKAS